MLTPRNIRVHDDEIPKHVWSLCFDQRKSAEANTDTMKIALQKDGLWLDEETELTEIKIEDQIKRLTTAYEANEAQWRAQFWEPYFFRVLVDQQACLTRKTEERQCHSYSYKNNQDSTDECDETTIEEVDQISRFVEERSPPIVLGVRHSLPVLSTPLQRCKKSTGYVYSDLIYAVDMWGSKNEDFQQVVETLPTISLSQDKTHHGGWLLVEFKRKPSKAETHLKDIAVRYASFTAAVLLHEKLKLCYMASEGSFAKNQYKDLNVHIFAAVGFIAYHYIHCLRPGKPGCPVKYESYLIDTYHLNFRDNRNRFRHTLNLLHVYHSTIIKDIEIERLKTVVALDPTERQNRLQRRTHKKIWFEILEYEGNETIMPHNDSLCPQATVEEPRLEFLPDDGYAAIDGRQSTAGEPAIESPFEGYVAADADIAEGKQQKEKKQRCGFTTKQGRACKNPASSCRFPQHQKQALNRAKIANKNPQPGSVVRRT